MPRLCSLSLSHSPRPVRLGRQRGGDVSIGSDEFSCQRTHSEGAAFSLAEIEEEMKQSRSFRSRPLSLRRCGSHPTRSHPARAPALPAMPAPPPPAAPGPAPATGGEGASTDAPSTSTTVSTTARNAAAAAALVVGVPAAMAAAWWVAEKSFNSVTPYQVRKERGCGVPPADGEEEAAADGRRIARIKNFNLLIHPIRLSVRSLLLSTTTAPAPSPPTSPACWPATPTDGAVSKKEKEERKRGGKSRSPSSIRGRPWPAARPPSLSLSRARMPSCFSERENAENPDLCSLSHARLRKRERERERRDGERHPPSIHPSSTSPLISPFLHQAVPPSASTATAASTCCTTGTRTR